VSPRQSLVAWRLARKLSVVFRARIDNAPIEELPQWADHVQCVGDTYKTLIKGCLNAAIAFLSIFIDIL
jgi:hypothetical protein